MFDSDVQAVLTEMGCLERGMTLSQADSLFDTGVLNSIRLMELVARLEQRFGVRVSQDDLTPDNFDSVAAISAYLAGLRAATAGAESIR